MLIVIAVAMWWVYRPVLEHQFLNWDDHDAVARNTALTGGGLLAWSFTTDHMGHYQPLAWLAWGVVAQIFGTAPQAFHALSLGVHIVNALLVSWLATRLAARAGLSPRISALAGLASALLFAVHPLRVEAVAWISAFPYLLALAFLLLSLHAYLAAYGGTERQHAWRGMSAAMYGCSLLARPIAFGYPLALLALDWHLVSGVGRTGTSKRAGPDMRSLGRLALNKWAIVILAIAAAAAEARARTFDPLTEVGMAARIMNAASAPMLYVWRSFAPFGLSPVEVTPLDAGAPWLALIMAIATLVATAATWHWRHRAPWLFTAWVSYLALLFPASGVLPSGLQLMSARYLYLPAVVLAGLAAVSIIAVERAKRGAGVVLAASLFVALSIGARGELGWWRDSVTLWSRAVALDQKNDVALYNVAVALAERGQEQDAIGRYEQLLALVPDHAPAQRNLSLLRARQMHRDADARAQSGDLQGAIDAYREVLELDPARVRALASRGLLLVQAGRFAEAVEELQKASAAGISEPPVINALAYALLQEGRSPEAVAVLKRGLGIHPDNPEIAHNLARVLVTSSDATARDAEVGLRLAHELERQTGGRDPRILDTLAAAYALNGQGDRAIETAARAARLARELGDPDMAAQLERRLRAYRARRP
jgi:tetratricopeptide (TPR) repeat protein